MEYKFIFSQYTNTVLFDINKIIFIVQELILKFKNILTRQSSMNFQNSLDKYVSSQKG